MPSVLKQPSHNILEVSWRWWVMFLEFCLIPHWSESYISLVCRRLCPSERHLTLTCCSVFAKVGSSGGGESWHAVSALSTCVCVDWLWGRDSSPVCYLGSKGDLPLAWRQWKQPHNPPPPLTNLWMQYKFELKVKDILQQFLGDTPLHHHLPASYIQRVFLEELSQSHTVTGCYFDLQKLLRNSST